MRPLRRSRILHPSRHPVLRIAVQAVTIIGAGPAGTAAALTALQAGAPVSLYERSTFPRHKVCGEFLSPETAAVLGRLGTLPAVEAARPARITRFRVTIGNTVRESVLPRAGYGLSRYCLDALLLDAACAAGAELHREQLAEPSGPVILASGRSASAPRGRRIFGFKAHFAGPATDAVELYFFPGGYVGLNAIEGGRTNVCGLAAEGLLAPSGFNPEALFDRAAALRARLRSLDREMDWLRSGPLIFENRFRSPAEQGVYHAGDALSFVDPFTGSGILSAMITGELAARALLENRPVAEYRTLCRKALGRPFRFASLFRAAVDSGTAGALSRLVPARLLFHCTRPREVY